MKITIYSQEYDEHIRVDTTNGDAVVISDLTQADKEILCGLPTINRWLLASTKCVLHSLTYSLQIQRTPSPRALYW